MSAHSQLGVEVPEEKGVQALIDRLKHQGIEAGQQQSQTLIQEAQAKARKIVAEAQAEAQRLRVEAREAAEREKTAGQEALRLAARDVLISLKNQIAGLFSEVLGRQVSAQFDQEAFLQKLLIAVCQRETEGISADQALKVLLSESRSNGHPNSESPVANWILALCQEGLRDGIEFAASDDRFKGFKVRVEDEQIAIDLSDQVVAQMLEQYLLPRFRSVLEGYV
jgi:V/A-type H+-transporting ATPase subunit E